MTRFLLLLLALLLSPLTLPACAPPVTIVTQPGKTAYTADQIVVRVNELQNAAISAERTGGLPTATTRVVVTFAVAADQVLAATPAGWQATVLQLWTNAKRNLTGVTNPAVVAALSAVDVVMGSLQP